MGRVFQLLGLLLAIAGPARAPAADEVAAGDCAARAVAALEGRYRDLRDLRAHFEQTTRSLALGSGAGAEQRSEGTVWFAKPGRMRWEYEQPAPSLLVSDGTTLWIYDPELREAQRLPVGEGALSGAAIQFLLGQGDVAGSFHVTAESCDEHAAELALVPREPASYERLWIRADLATGDVLETRVVDLLGNATRVRFSDLRANRGPAPEVFRFTAPEGVRVVDLTPVAPGSGAEQ